MSKTQFNLVLSYILVFAFGLPVLAQFELDVETGAVFSGYNDVRIPGDGGTLFSLSDELETDADFFYRIRLFYSINPHHHIGVLFAPLSLQATGRLDRELIFRDQVFAADTPFDATYQFNSYRLTYRYDFLRRETIELGIGFTGKIRDAKVAVKGNGIEGEKTNVGFVPLIHFKLLWRFSDAFTFLLDGDALAAPQGRAEDVLAAISTQVSDGIDLKLGYRILEGGADNETVYNFTLVHYASISALLNF